MRKRLVLAVAMVLGMTVTASGKDPKDKPVYEPYVKDAVLTQIEEKDQKAKEEEQNATAEIRKRQKEEKKRKEDARVVLMAQLPEKERPASLDAFKQVFHFPPQAQYLTGTCWAYSGTSYVESEVFRLTGKQVKLSEMYVVYWEYVEKARRYMLERGDSSFNEGSEVNAVTRMIQMYGAVPLSAYAGTLEKDGLHDHSRMFEEMRSFLRWVRANELWDEELALDTIRDILDKYMGRPPEQFEHEGKKYTPAQFVTDVMAFHPEDYVQFMSTMKLPFYQQAEFDVPDNWWHDATYYNVPLEEFYGVVDYSIRNGYSLGIGGDVSEPGRYPKQDIMFIPSFDIPLDHIDQAAREYRIDNGSTGDDHGIHLVGWAKVAGKLWFLIKDSGRSARYGRFEGYYFFREDFIRLKMLTVMVHKDAVADLLKKFQPQLQTP